MNRGVEEQFPWLLCEVDDNFVLLYWMSLAGPMHTGCVTSLLTVLMSGNRELAFYSGEGTRETSTTFHAGCYKI